MEAAGHITAVAAERIEELKSGLIIAIGATRPKKKSRAARQLAAAFARGSRARVDGIVPNYDDFRLPDSAVESSDHARELRRRAADAVAANQERDNFELSDAQVGDNSQLVHLRARARNNVYARFWTLIDHLYGRLERKRRVLKPTLAAAKYKSLANDVAMATQEDHQGGIVRGRERSFPLTSPSSSSSSPSSSSVESLSSSASAMSSLPILESHSSARPDGGNISFGSADLSCGRYVRAPDGGSTGPRVSPIPEFATMRGGDDSAVGVHINGEQRRSRLSETVRTLDIAALAGKAFGGGDHAVAAEATESIRQWLKSKRDEIAALRDSVNRRERRLIDAQGRADEALVGLLIDREATAVAEAEAFVLLQHKIKQHDTARAEYDVIRADLAAQVAPRTAVSRGVSSRRHGIDIAKVADQSIAELHTSAGQDAEANDIAEDTNVSADDDVAAVAASDLTKSTPGARIEAHTADDVLGTFVWCPCGSSCTDGYCDSPYTTACMTRPVVETTARVASASATTTDSIMQENGDAPSSGRKRSRELARLPPSPTFHTKSYPIRYAPLK